MVGDLFTAINLTSAQFNSSNNSAPIQQVFKNGNSFLLIDLAWVSIAGNKLKAELLKNEHGPLLYETIYLELVNTEDYKLIDSARRANDTVSYFRTCLFKGAIAQSMNRTVQDFEVFAAQFSRADKKTTWFGNILKPPAHDFSIDFYKTLMVYGLIKPPTKKKYDSRTRQATVQAEFYTLCSYSYM